MANVIEKVEKVARTNVGLLERELTLPRVVTRDLGGTFVGAKDDTIKMPIDSIVDARQRTLRSTADLVTDEFAETTVDVKLDQHFYRRTAVSLAQLTLDITDYSRQISMPAVKSVARKMEDHLASVIEGATYAINVGAINAADPWITIMSARSAMNKALIPHEGRFLAVGADVEEALLKSDRIAKVDQSGSDDALRSASLGMIGGFMAISVPGLDPKTAVVAHRSAFALAVKSPAVPQGAKGAAAGHNGLAMTAIFDYSDVKSSDAFGAHTFAGVAVVKDAGTLGTDGRFTPKAVPALDDSDKILVRAVKMALA